MEASKFGKNFCAFRRKQDLFWRALFHPTTLFAAVVMAIRGALAILQSAANVIGMMTR
jgi:hypothetical protein